MEPVIDDLALDERFARHTLIPGWDQARLLGTSIVVMGVGAVGNEVARLLALSGVGRLLLCDPDRVERTNLSRCPLFQEGDIGRFKVEAATESLIQLAPHLTVEARPQPLVNGVGLAELRDADLIISCLDSRSARLQLAGRCGLIRAPWIDGGTHAWGGEVRPYLDPDGPCYGCSLTPSLRATHDIAVSCMEQPDSVPVGASALISVLVGAWLATLAVRYLLDLPVPSDLLKIDSVNGLTTRLTQRRDPDCPLHEPIGSPVVQLPLDNSATVGALRAKLPPGSTPLLWDPVQTRLQCLACGFERERWGRPERSTCPECGEPMHTWSCLELTTATPDQLPLQQLGIAPREILAVRPAGERAELRWIELAR